MSKFVTIHLKNSKSQKKISVYIHLIESTGQLFPNLQLQRVPFSFFFFLQVELKQSKVVWNGGQVIYNA